MAEPGWVTKARERLKDGLHIRIGSDLHLLEMAVNDYLNVDQRDAELEPTLAEALQGMILTAIKRGRTRQDFDYVTLSLDQLTQLGLVNPEAQEELDKKRTDLERGKDRIRKAFRPDDVVR